MCEVLEAVSAVVFQFRNSNRVCESLRKKHSNKSSTEIRKTINDSDSI